MPNKRILIFGDCMLDRYIIGDANRISPEAPVPVVSVNRIYHTLGGAANVANNLINVGIKNDLCGGFAQDENGKLLSTLLAENGIGNKLRDVLDTTISKTRIISRNQQMIRIDFDGKVIKDGLLNEIQDADLSRYKNIIISDYGKGSCSDGVLRALIDKSRALNIKVLVDPKGANWEKYRGAYLVKPNIGELEEVLGKNIPNEDEDVRDACKILIEKYDIQNIVATRGDKGMVLVNKNTVHFFRAKKVEVFDVSGAGDTAIAILAYGLSEGYNLENSIIMANLASSFVVTRPQTYAITKAELLGLTNKIMKE